VKKSSIKKTSINNNLIIETIDYNIFRKKVTYYQLNEFFEPLKEIVIPMKNMPIVHDFIATSNTIVLSDSPISVSLSFKLSRFLSLYLNKNKKTNIYVVNKDTSQIDININNPESYLPQKEKHLTLEEYQMMMSNELKQLKEQ
jgi:carotenoid cleavage dioxygenase-like enzyme